MTPDDRAARDPQRLFHRAAGFTTEFRPHGEPLRNDDASFARLGRYAARLDGETDAAYIHRMEHDIGMVISVTTAEVKANPRVLRDKMMEAGQAGVPLLIVQEAAPDRRIRIPTAADRDADEQRKAEVLDQLRNPQRVAADAERARQFAMDARLAAEHNARMEKVMGWSVEKLTEHRDLFPSEDAFQAALATARAAAA